MHNAARKTDAGNHDASKRPHSQSPPAPLAEDNSVPSKASAYKTDIRLETTTLTVSGEIAVISLQISPADARVSLDGELLMAGQNQLRLRTSEEKHELRVAAEGYETHTRVFAPTGDKTITIALRKQKQSEKPGAQATGDNGARPKPRKKRMPTSKQIQLTESPYR